MCRLAAYMGPELPLKNLLEEPPNSLVKQSWAAEELQGTTLNADGFGFGWYLPDSTPAIYRSLLPIWSDTNLPSLGRALQSRIWLAYIRSATPGQVTSEANTQPFQDDSLLFLHNGRIENFNDGPRAKLHEVFSAAIAADIQGNTDSEYIFALYRQYRRENENTTDALTNLCTTMEKLLAGTPVMINVIISDGEKIHGCRHAVNGAWCPSLYYTETHTSFTQGIVVASERFSNHDDWNEIPAHSIFTIDQEQKLSIKQL